MTFENLDTLLAGKIDFDDAKDLVAKASLAQETATQRRDKAHHDLSKGLAEVARHQAIRKMLQLHGANLPPDVLAALEQLEAGKLALLLQAIQEKDAGEDEQAAETLAGIAQKAVPMIRLPKGEIVKKHYIL
jgi:hypothetical protein